MDIKEKIEQQRNLAAEKATASKAPTPIKLTHEEAERQFFEQSGLVEAVSSLKDSTGDRKARVEVFQNSIATLVWDEERVREKSSTVNHPSARKRLSTRELDGDHLEITEVVETYHCVSDVTRGRRMRVELRDWNQAVSEGRQEDFLAEKFVEEEQKPIKSVDTLNLGNREIVSSSTTKEIKKKVVDKPPRQCNEY